MKPILEHLDNTEQKSLFSGEYQKPTFRFPWHYHPQWELTYIIRGSGTAYAGSTLRHFAHGELALLRPNVPHCWKSHEEATTDVHSVYFQWEEQLLGTDWIDKKEFAGIKRMLENCQAGLIFDAEISSSIGGKLQSLHQQSSIQKLLGFIEVLDELSKQKAKPIGRGITTENTSASKRIENIMNYVSNHFSDTITAEDMATVTSMTQVSFSKYFTRTFGKPFTVFLNEFRVSQACSLLISNDDPVSQVAFLCGYQNMAYFHRQFKKITGKTPSDFRKTYREVQAI